MKSIIEEQLHQIKASPSLRRVWVEIVVMFRASHVVWVTLLAEGVG